MITTSNFSILFPCHSERSEESLAISSVSHGQRNLSEMFRCAQHDKKEKKLKIQWQLLRVLDALFNFDQKGHGFFPVDQAVVVAQRQIHHRPNLDFSFDRDGSRHDLVHPENSALGEI